MKGTCNKLEKEYFRLTSFPDMSEVRPEHILKKSFEILLEKTKKLQKDNENKENKNSNTKDTKSSYNHILNQFKSIRQVNQ